MADTITISKDTANACLSAIGIAMNMMTADGPPSGEAALTAFQAMEKAQAELMSVLKEPP